MSSKRQPKGIPTYRRGPPTKKPIGSLPGPEGPALETSPKQDEFINAVFSGEYNYLAFGGGIRGTKTWTGLIVLIMLCKMFPGSRWAVVRRDLPTLRRNTIPSLNKLRYTVSNFVGDLNQATWTYRCANGSEIVMFPESVEQDPDLDRWKGLEVNGFLLEEANELQEKSFAKAIERAGSWIIPGTTTTQPPILILLTFNPAPNWVKTTFYLPWKAKTLKKPYFFLPATIFDNPWASEAYRESLKNLPPEDYNRFVMGEWEGSDDPDQLIKAEWVWAARNVPPVEGMQALGIDVAQYGDDKTTFALIDGNELKWIKAYEKLSIDRTATIGAAFAASEEYHIDPGNIRIDVVGVGAGVGDLMKKAGFPVFRIVSGSKPYVRKGSFYRFYNLRSQMWWEAREKLRMNLVSLPEDTPIELISDLTTPRFEIRADRTILVESKKDIKTRIGRSTDYGDSYVYALFDIPPRSKKIILPPSISRVMMR